MLTRILVISVDTIFNIIYWVANAIFRFNRSDSLQAIWPVAGQVVTADMKNVVC